MRGGVPCDGSRVRRFPREGARTAQLGARRMHQSNVLRHLAKEPNEHRGPMLERHAQFGAAVGGCGRRPRRGGGGRGRGGVRRRGWLQQVKDSSLPCNNSMTRSADAVQSFSRAQRLVLRLMARGGLMACGLGESARVCVWAGGVRRTTLRSLPRTGQSCPLALGLGARHSSPPTQSCRIRQRGVKRRQGGIRRRLAHEGSRT